MTRTPSAYVSTYLSPGVVATGTWQFDVSFTSDAKGKGTVVGIAASMVTINADGSGIGDITTQGLVTSSEIPVGLVVKIGESKAIPVAARDASGNLVAVSPGSIFVTQSSGANCLSLSNVAATGIALGTATITATVDGRASKPTDVAVASADDPDTGSVVSTWTQSVQPSGVQVTDAAQGINFSIPAGACVQPSNVSFEVRSNQRAVAEPDGFVASANAVDLYLDPSQLAANASLSIEIPSPGPYDSIGSMVFVTDDDGNFIPLDVTYNESHDSLVGILTAVQLRNLGNSSNRTASKGHTGRSKAQTLVNPRFGIFATYLPGSDSTSRRSTVTLPLRIHDRRQSDRGGQRPRQRSTRESLSYDTNAAGWFIFDKQANDIRERNSTDSMSGHTVAVLLHGNTNTAHNMTDLARFLFNDLSSSVHFQVYDQVWIYQYNWRAHIATNGMAFAQSLTSEMVGANTVDIYAHSMGGLVSRYALERAGLGAKVRRLVMLGTPNLGVPKGVIQLDLFAADLIGAHDGPADLVGTPGDGADSFINQLNAGDSPYLNSAEYFTLAGSDYSDYIVDNLPFPLSFLRYVGASSETAYMNYFNQSNGVTIDGIVAQYSALSLSAFNDPVLAHKSAAWSDTLHHTATVYLTHDQLKGSSDPSTQAIMESAVTPWIVTPFSGSVR